MKKLLLAAFALAAASPVYAGRLQGVTISGAPRIVVTGTYTQAAPLQAAIRITNNSGRTLTLGFQRQIIMEVPGSENNFCFGVNCFPPNVTTSPTNAPVVLPNGQFDDSGILDYTPNNRPGITTIRYALFEQGTQDSTYVTVVFDASRSSLAVAATRAAESILSQPWPNPAAAGAAELRYTLPTGTTQGQLVLFSLADGRRVREVALRSFGPEARVLVGTEGLAPGFYSVHLLGDNGRLLAARRLQVQ